MKSQEILAYPDPEPLPLLVIFLGLTPSSPARGAFCTGFLKHYTNNIERLWVSNVSFTSHYTTRLYVKNSFMRSPFSRTLISLLR